VQWTQLLSVLGKFDFEVNGTGLFNPQGREEQACFNIQK
jgi:hypothetical protein